MQNIIKFPVVKKLNKTEINKMCKKLSLHNGIINIQIERKSATAELDLLMGDETSDFDDIVFAISKIEDLYQKEIDFLVNFSERMIKKYSKRNHEDAD